MREGALESKRRKEEGESLMRDEGRRKGGKRKAEIIGTGGYGWKGGGVGGTKG